MDLADLAVSFKRSLRAENKAERTVETYTEALERFHAFLKANSLPTDVREISRGDVEAFIGHLLERFKPATASNRYRALQTFFRWCVDEDELVDSPMRNMRPPNVPEVPVPVLTDAQIKRLVRVTSGKDGRPCHFRHLGTFPKRCPGEVIDEWSPSRAGGVVGV